MEKFFTIRSNTDQIFTGSILIAEPLMPDKHFSRSVVLLIDHKDDEGTLGIIINKRLNISLQKIVRNFEFKNFNPPVFFGGPVAVDQLFFMHKSSIPIENSVEITKGLFWGGNIEQIDMLIRTGQLKENEIRFYVGYSGWAAGQLKNELKQNSWAVTFASTEEIWYTEPSRMWDLMISKLGAAYAFWRKMPLDPTLN